MYKTIIIDDEIWVIRGLMKAIPWEELGFEIVFHSTSSIHAYEMIEILKPDLILSDIKMPEMSGLELLEKLQSTGSTAQVVLMSAYAEFEYAHTALRLGAFDYLIKPLNKKDVTRTLGNVKTVLDSTNVTPFAEIDEHLITSNARISVGDILTKNNISPGSEKYCIACYAKGYFDTGRIIYSKIQHQELFDAIIFENDRFCYMLAVHNDLLHQCLEKEAEDNIMFFGVSRQCVKDDLIGDYLQQAKHMALQFLLCNCPTVAVYKDQNPSDVVIKHKHSIREALSNGNCSVIETMIKQLPDFISKNYCDFQEFLGIAACIYYEIERFNSESAKAINVTSAEDFLNKYHHLDEYIDDLLNEIFKQYGRTQTATIDVYAVENYINQRFTGINSVNEIAQHFHVDVTYLSRLYKREKGVTIKSFLISKKIDLAKHLLCNSNLKIYEISNATGYTEYFHFTKMFHKFTGETPTQFRERHS